MLNVDKVRGRLAELRLTQKDVANALGIEKKASQRMSSFTTRTIASDNLAKSHGLHFWDASVSSSSCLPRFALCNTIHK